ncbi:hypothetical protein KIPB_001888 [Kipferlia bialata]|uniref:Uncharacterized protein n=1 Tax=Kipferlia bialata TaxID=797122 RepID=A0A9K3GFQ0_9EUKA|nr:hypothetical protein KIPB_001888 [Kipferlia bialata]|eukprot:g1888.t1
MSLVKDSDTGRPFPTPSVTRRERERERERETYRVPDTTQWYGPSEETTDIDQRRMSVSGWSPFGSRDKTPQRPSHNRSKRLSIPSTERLNPLSLLEASGKGNQLREAIERELERERLGESQRESSAVWLSEPSYSGTQGQEDSKSSKPDLPFPPTDARVLKKTLSEYEGTTDPYERCFTDDFLNRLQATHLPMYENIVHTGTGVVSVKKGTVTGKKYYSAALVITNRRLLLLDPYCLPEPEDQSPSPSPQSASRSHSSHEEQSS